MTHVYGQNSVPHNEEAEKLCRARAVKSAVHKVSRRCRSAEGQQRGSMCKVVRGCGVKKQMALQVTDCGSEDSVHSDRNRHKCHPELLEVELDYPSDLD